MKYINIKFLIILIVASAVVSCSKKPDVENTSTYKMAGEWYIRYYTGGSAVTNFSRMLTYNTSDPSSNQIWVDDEGEWPLKAKFNVDYANLAFSAMASTPNTALTGKTVKVMEGKVVPKAGHSKTGVVVDSIYLKLEFSDDPGTTYEIRGHQRTGFFEDEY